MYCTKQAILSRSINLGSTKDIPKKDSSSFFRAKK